MAQLDPEHDKKGFHVEEEELGTPNSSLTPVTTHETRRRANSHQTEAPEDVAELHKIPTTRTRRDSHMGEALENLSRTLSVDVHAADDHELGNEPSRRMERSGTRRSARYPSPSRMSDLEEEGGSPSESKSKSQGVPPELGSFTAEVIFILVCSAGLLLFAFFLGDITVNQEECKRALGISNSELPWLMGSFTLPLSLSVVISGSLSDLTPPRTLMIGAFAWLTIWNVVGVFSVTPATAILFYIVRAMQGLSVGVLVSGSMSILGRVYKPGLRKNRVFSAMSATSPFGFWLGGIQGGALKSYLYWIFGSNAIICALCLVAAWFTMPSLRPVADIAGADAPSIRDFDFIGASFIATGCVFVLFGLTQGSVVKWSPYTYALFIVGVILVISFFFIERWVKRPLIPNGLWKIKGFTPLMIAYFIGYGGFQGGWQFYAVQFWLRIQQNTPLTVALYLLPNAIVGVLATWVVSRTLHIVPGHYIYLTAMIAFAMGPVFFLPQTPNTSYWPLSFPGVALVTFGPDLSFAAASIYITSNVPRSYQGSAGSLLVTMQNLSSAVMTAVADAIGTQVDQGPDGDIGLKGIHAIWWFALACEVVAALITLFWVRIPKEEEKEHVT
jgi:MFS family permease